jgi:hypothetical protein
MNYFDSDMSNSTNTKTVIYIYACEQCRTQFEQRIIHQHVLLRGKVNHIYIYDGKVSHIYIYDGKVSIIDGASVTIILCLHVLIARRILLILDMWIIFSEYRCLTR